MAVELDMAGNEAKYEITDGRKLGAICCFIGAVSKGLLVVALCCFAAILIQVLGADCDVAAVVPFAEWGLVAGIYAYVLQQLASFFEQAIEYRATLLKKGALLMKKVALAFIVLFLISIAFSLLALVLSGEDWNGFSLSLPLGGFPSNEIWDEIAFGYHEGKSIYGMSIDLSPLLVALVLFGFSSVFRYGAYLQEERDSVV